MMHSLLSLLCRIARFWPWVRGRDFLLRHILRRPAWCEALASQPTRVMTRGGFAMQVNAGNDFTSMCLKLFGNIEPPTEEFILAHVPEKGGFADIGANVGYFSLLVANRRQGASVYAFEPNPPIASVLAESIRSDHLEGQVTLYRLAVGDRAGMLPFCLHDTNTGHSRLASNDAAGDIEVSVVIWDEWWPQQQPEPKIHCVKMDIEGAEVLALRGMRQFLLRQKPALILEAFDDQLGEFGSSAVQLRQLILDLGYQEARPADCNFYFTHPLS